MLKYAYIFMLVLMASNISLAEEITLGSYYVNTEVLNVRLAPNSTGKITNKIYRQQKVDVLELKSGWARISKYYDGSFEDMSGQVARWVSANRLSKNKPSDVAQPDFKKDPRINGIPKVGQYGLTESDVSIMYAGAHHYLNIGKCKKVEYADKSISKAGVYYINCGGPNIFFKPSDIPK